MHRNIITN